jgi:histone H3/H4
VVRANVGITAVALREIRRYQKSTDLLLPKRSFRRLCQEIADGVMQETPGSTGSIRWQPEALAAVQEACEAYVVQMFEGMYKPMIIISFLRRKILSKLQRRKSVCNSCKAGNSNDKGHAAGASAKRR